MLASLLARDADSEGHRTVARPAGVDRPLAARPLRRGRGRLRRGLRAGPWRPSGTSRRERRDGPARRLGGAAAGQRGSHLGVPPVPARPAAARARRRCSWTGSSRRCAATARARRASVEGSWNVAYLAEVMERFGLGDRWAVLHDGGRAVLGMSDAALDRAVDRAGAAAERERLRRDAGARARAGAAARLPRHRPRLRPDVAGARPARPLRRPRRVRDDRRADRAARTARSRPAASTGSRRRNRSCSSEWPAQAAGGPGAAAASRPSRAGAGPSPRSSTRASPTGCACTSSGASPSCRAARRSALEVALDIHEAETARPRAAALERMAPGRPRGGGGRPVGLPRLRAALEGRS